MVDENDKPIDDAEVSIPMVINGSMCDKQGLAGVLAAEINGIGVSAVNVNLK